MINDYRVFDGESAGARTQDQRLKRAMLYQLSYALEPHSNGSISSGLRGVREGLEKRLTRTPGEGAEGPCVGIGEQCMEGPRKSTVGSGGGGVLQSEADAAASNFAESNLGAVGDGQRHVSGAKCGREFPQLRGESAKYLKTIAYGVTLKSYRGLIDLAWEPT